MPRGLAEQVRERAMNEPDPVEIAGDDAIPDHIDPNDLIPTGSTMLDLALSDRAEGGWHKGKIDLLIGDSDSGKTILGLTEFAVCASLPRFDDYRLIYDAVETNSAINVRKLLGNKVAERLEAPQVDPKTGEPIYSDTVQDFLHNVLNALDDGRPFLWLLDSWDALSSEEEIKKVEQQHDAWEKDKEAAGHMGMEKAKGAHQLFRLVKARLKKSQSHLLIIFQTKDVVNPMPGQKTKTHGGGNAPKFYAQHTVWLSIVGQETRGESKAKRKVGVNTLASVDKNHLTGKKRDARFTIYYDYGVDDTSSMVDFLLETGYWDRKGSYILPEGLGVLEQDKYYKKELVELIEQKGLDRRLKRCVQESWTKVEESLKLGRKPRFE